MFIEFLTYNANYNVFNAITLLFEQSVTGYTFKRVEVSRKFDLIKRLTQF